ncbi:hypothetical protein SODALDRAFT_79322 [Sodiomyces alkalinus F11]|uniref:Leucine rich repeat domain-containing protein n=1 Tax=Sodiomyces alkalinus (strain CBS 110278 / VKM F-3762 / F11) TaxID=1314773 RepID=A0A3N2PKY3_SODAK|nr:hypothetical protein SODALDRAFT_79322 [Sodiomyces alkalinus F11]ROT35193.1 hypothetical protein SODALDRAFT_79322 [Sodiomyces alkalinus F11]
MAQQPQLPSYEEAISRLDWVGLVAPYTSVSDYSRLCSVNRHFHTVFAPLLWHDPLNTVRLLGLRPSNDLDWYCHFVLHHVFRVRPVTLALVTVLDFRNFAKATAHFWSDNDSRSIPVTFKILPRLFPALRCILLDGHTDADPAALAVGGPTPAPWAGRPWMLSIPDCASQLPATFFLSDYVQDLVYLDISGLPGSLQSLVSAAEGARHLPRLKVLKIQGRELGDNLAARLFEAFDARLWSLDLSHNNLTDDVIEPLSWHCLQSPPLRSGRHFRTEGKLVSHPVIYGDSLYGPFKLIEESERSGAFDHPERYFADAPLYHADPARAVYQDQEDVRADGRGPPKYDSADYVKSAIIAGVLSTTPALSDLPPSNVSSSAWGITHLDLTGNRFTSFGLEKLIRTTPGQLEYLACDAPLVHAPGFTWPSSWPEGTRLHGIPGSAHAFRPVFSPNLRALRIHHSLVTQIPTLEAEGLSTMARWWMAETAVRERVEMAYPQAFQPDMSPRLASLTLTRIPRRSAGPLLGKLTQFLKLVAAQEQGICEATPDSSSRRSPTMLRGLRHIRLEFEVDPVEDAAGFLDVDALDAEALLSMGEGEGFSFFGDEFVRPKPKLPPRRVHDATATPTTIHMARLQHAPFTTAAGEHVQHVMSWNGKTFEAPVWIGPGVLGPRPAVNAYMMALRDPALRQGIVGPAMPTHVQAGVPPDALLFYGAWDATIIPDAPPSPSRAEIHGMRDVIDGLKAFRADTKARYEEAPNDKRSSGLGVNAMEPHHFWTGKLEVAI